MTENTAGKKRGKLFQPGKSGNPAGKPKGAKNKATLLAQTLFEDEAAMWVRAHDKSAVPVLCPRFYPW